VQLAHPSTAAQATGPSGGCFRLSSLAATLIFIERSAILPSARPAMKFRILRFRVDCSYEEKRHENAHWTRAELIAEILREYEHSGDAPLVPS
jgi:hypothetical protein